MARSRPRLSFARGSPPDGSRLARLAVPASDRVRRMARLASIWIKRAHRGPMDPADRATLVGGAGIQGNADYGSRRHVTLLSAERWREAESELGASVPPAARRANLLVEGADFKESRGRRLRIGSCRLLVKGETRPCHRMDEAWPGLQRALGPDWRAGAWAEIEVGGEIAVGDAVEWESEA